ncbi:MAG: GNAT family N-acetyltransferase [Stellaceae bacterium]
MAHSETALPPGIGARPLDASDLDTALELSREAHWNQVAADWRIFLELGSGIALTRHDTGRLVATAAMLPFGDEFAWISMVLVTAAERRRGLARWLLGQCVSRLLARGLVPVLDATPAGRAVYLGLGFEDCWGLQRFVARTTAPARAAPAPPGFVVRALAPEDWPRLEAFDAGAFGAARPALLRRLAERLPVAALVAERGGRIAGYLLGRDGHAMTQLGPLAAENEPVAQALLAHAIEVVPAPLAVDAPDRHAGVCRFLEARAFAAERPWTRMRHGSGVSFGDGARLFAIAGPEFG